MASLLQRGRELHVMLTLARQSNVRYLRTAPVALKKTRTQSGFVGLENCFVWDDQNGFGFNKDGEVVIVTPHTEASQKFSSGTSSTYVENTPELEEAVSDEEDDDNNYPACAGSKY